MWACKPLRTKYFHGVSAGNRHPYLLKSQYGKVRIIVDRVSGTVADRPGLRQIKDIVREGDTLVVWRLDRLGRSIKDLIAWVHWLEQEGAGLKSLQEAIDTASTGGKLIFHILRPWPNLSGSSSWNARTRDCGLLEPEAAWADAPKR